MGQSDRGPAIDWWEREGFAEGQTLLSWDLKGQVRTSQTKSRGQVSRQWQQHEWGLWAREDVETGRWLVYKEQREWGGGGWLRRLERWTEHHLWASCKILRPIKDPGFYIEWNGKPFKDFSQEYMVILFTIKKKSLCWVKGEWIRSERMDALTTGFRSVSKIPIITWIGPERHLTKVNVYFY